MFVLLTPGGLALLGGGTDEAPGQGQGQQGGGGRGGEGPEPAVHVQPAPEEQVRQILLRLRGLRGEQPLHRPGSTSSDQQLSR